MGIHIYTRSCCKCLCVIKLSSFYVTKTLATSAVCIPSSVSIVLVNLNRQKPNEKMLESLNLSFTEITDPVYEIFTVRSILSLRLDSTEFNIMLLDRLRTIGIEYRNDLEPTHLCNNIRRVLKSIKCHLEPSFPKRKNLTFETRQKRSL